MLADYTEFPDCNTCMMIDKSKKLWVFWPIILDNEWDSALTNYRVSSDYEGDGPPKWEWQGVIFLKPDDFKDEALSLFRKSAWRTFRPRTPERVKNYQRHAGNKTRPASYRSAWAGSRAANPPCFRPAASCCRSIATRFRSRSWPSATTTGKTGTPAAC